MREIQAGQGIKILDDPHGMVVNVTAPISDAKLAAMLTGGEAGEVAAAAPEAAGAEKGKPEAAPASEKAAETKK